MFNMKPTPKRLDITGYNLESSMTGLNPEVDLDYFLGEIMQVNPAIVDNIIEDVRSAPTVIAPSDAMAIAIDNIPEHDGTVTRILDTYLQDPNSIVIRTGLVELFCLARDKPGVGFMNASPEEVRTASSQMAVIFMLGEYVAAKVYREIVQKFESAQHGLLPPVNLFEASGFFEQIQRDVESRNPGLEMPEFEPSQEAFDDYFRHTRANRFSATGGWLLVDHVDERVQTGVIKRAMRQYHFDQNAAGNILHPQDIGSLYPLEFDEFMVLISYLRKDAKVIPISQRG